jgi:4-amino-4-deoxy-L-arabinose transferase-like glycosyltransferase
LTDRFSKLLFPFLLLLVASVYLYTASSRAILDDGDALYSTVARQMVQTGDWITPYANGVRFLDKPPVMYWLMALAIKVLGMNEFAVRLPSALAVLGTGSLLFFLGRKTCGPSAGFIAGLAVAFCVGTFLFTRMVFPDILFIFFLTLSLTAFLWWYSSDDNSAFPAMAFYAGLAGAVLTKGLIGLFFPLAIVCSFLIWEKRWKCLSQFHLLKGLSLFLILTFPWFVLVARRNPGFLWYFFVNEHWLRFLGRRQPVDYESISLGVFWALTLLWLFPWSAFFPALGTLLRAKELRPGVFRAAVRFSFVWAAVVMVFFSISSRIEHYALPAFPPLALLTGLALSPENPLDPTDEGRRRRWVARGFSFLGFLGGVVGLVILAAGLVCLGGRFEGFKLQDFAEGHLRAYRYYFAPLFDMPAHILGRLQAPLLGTSLTLAVGLPAAHWIDRRRKRMYSVLVLAVTMMIFCVLAFRSLGFCEEILSSRQFGERLNALSRTGDRVIVVGDFETANSLNFYCDIPLEIYMGTAAVLDWGLRYPDAPRRILSEDDFASRWASQRRIFVLMPDSRLEILRLEHACVVLKSAGRSLLCNQPAE